MLFGVNIFPSSDASRVVQLGNEPSTYEINANFVRMNIHAASFIEILAYLLLTRETVFGEEGLGNQIWI